MKNKIKLIILATIVIIASAFNFGILTKSNGFNFSKARNSGNFYNFYLPCVVDSNMGQLVDCDPGGKEICKQKSCQ